MKLKEIWDIGKTLLIALFLILLFRYLIVQPYFVSGNSMNPDFHDKEYVLIDEISYRFSQPHRGDVIVFKHPDTACISYVEKSPILKTFFSGPCENYIKRIIGLPGETIKITDGGVWVINQENPNGSVLKESYIQDNLKTLGDQTISLSKDEFFVLGDNRLPFASSDSREWGPLNRKYINGKAFIRLFPPNEIGLIGSGKY